MAVHIASWQNKEVDRCGDMHNYLGEIRANEKRQRYPSCTTVLSKLKIDPSNLDPFELAVHQGYCQFDVVNMSGY